MTVIDAVARARTVTVLRLAGSLTLARRSGRADRGRLETQTLFWSTSQDERDLSDSDSDSVTVSDSDSDSVTVSVSVQRRYAPRPNTARALPARNASRARSSRPSVSRSVSACAGRIIGKFEPNSTFFHPSAFR